jgi:WhiB family transcriptional regulator, redox-sensing transcriptional regulator
MTVPTWHLSANCRDTDPSVFFPADFSAYEGPPGVALATKAAKAICRECPVAAECFAWAWELDDRYAILGGHTAAERYEMRRKRVAS